MESIIYSLIPSDLCHAPDESQKRLESALFPEVQFYATYRQETRSLCGFHALFNAFTFLKKYAKGEPQSRAICSGWKYWKLQHRLLAYLLSHANLTETAKSALADTGPLERYQLEFLLSNYPPFQHLSLTIHWLPLYYGFGHFQMTDSDIASADRVFYQFFSGSGTGGVAVLLGVTNHWSVFLLLRNAQSQVETVYLDSKNMGEVLSLEENRWGEIIQKENCNRAAKGIEPMNKFMMNVRKQHTKDMQSIVTMLLEVAHSRKSLLSFKLTHDVTDLHQSFQSHLSLQSLSAAILKWLHEDVQPVVILEEAAALAETAEMQLDAWRIVKQWEKELIEISYSEVLKDCEREEQRNAVTCFFRLMEKLHSAADRVKVKAGDSE